MAARRFAPTAQRCSTMPSAVCNAVSSATPSRTALGAVRLGVAEDTALQTALGIVEQRCAVGAKRRAAMVVAAVHADHYFYGFELAHASDKAFVGGEFNKVLGH